MSAERKTSRFKKTLIIGTASTGLAISGLLGYEAIQPRQQTPEHTPITGGIVEPTPFITPEITIFPSLEITPTPTPEVTPSPTPSPTPEATPVPNIEKVKLAAEGLVTRDMVDYLNVYSGTVVAIERNPDGTVKQFAVTVAGKRINRTCSEIFKDSCTYTATTFWLNVKGPTKLGDINALPAFKQIGQGPKDISEYIEIGKAIPEVMISLEHLPGYPIWDKLNVLNRASLAKLNDSIGKTFPRSYKGFAFNPAAINVEP